MIEIIPAILLRFRLHQIRVIADIKRAFLQVSLGKDVDFLRFLWVNAEGDLKIFRHTRVTFGVTSSPFLLGAVIDFHLERCLAESDQNEWYDIFLRSLGRAFMLTIVSRACQITIHYICLWRKRWRCLPRLNLS